MTGKDFKSIRKGLGLSATNFGRALGYEGNKNTIHRTVTDYEHGNREIPPWIATLAIMYERFGIPLDIAADAEEPEEAAE